jgi:hypothetical protein
VKFAGKKGISAGKVKKPAGKHSILAGKKEKSQKGSILKYIEEAQLPIKWELTVLPAGYR